MRRIIVIGAGASGLMAACSAAVSGAEVLLLEKNEKAGKKIYITGKGRCNLTNAGDVADFFDEVVRNPRFLYRAVYDFTPEDMMKLMEDNGCPVKTERGGRVFPVSDHASDVTAALLRILKNENVKILYNTPVSSIVTAADSSENADGKTKVRGIKTAYGEVFEADAVILCTGGISYPATGSTGDGYHISEAMGHSIIHPDPALVPLETKEKWSRSLQGLSLKNVELSVYDPAARKKNRPVYSGFGEMLFTHFGISGPLVLSASSLMDLSEDERGRCREYEIILNLKPALTAEQLTARIGREFSEAPSRTLSNIMRRFFPARLSDVIASLSGMDPARKASSFSEKEMASLAELMQAVRITVQKSRGFNEAIITKGGVNTKEIDPYTMESKLVEGLFFAGELMDVNAQTGGYNLQIAWSTGHLAGKAAAGALE